MESSTPPSVTEEFDDANGSGRRIRSIIVSRRRGFSEPDSSSSPLSSDGPVGPSNDPADSVSSMERWETTRPSDDETGKNFRPRNEEFIGKHGSDDQSRIGRRRRRYSEHATSSSSLSSVESDSDRSRYRSHRFKSKKDRVTSDGSAGPTINVNSSLSREPREATRFSAVERGRNFWHKERVNRRIDNVVEGLEPLRRDVFSTAERKRQFRDEFGGVDRPRGGRRWRRLPEYATSSSSSSSDDSDRSRRSRVTSGGPTGPFNGSVDGDETNEKPRLSREQREAIRFLMVERQRKKDFRHMEMIKGRMVNILEGLELHRDVFSAAEQKRIVDSVYDFQEKGRNRQLRGIASKSGH